jgi:hypothetical protein
VDGASIEAARKDIPIGWGLLIDFSTREKGDRNGAHGSEYVTLLKACENQIIPAFKQSKCWVLRLEDAQTLLKKNCSPKTYEVKLLEDLRSEMVRLHSRLDSMFKIVNIIKDTARTAAPENTAPLGPRIE